MTGELMTGDGRWLAVAALAVATPEELAPQPALHVRRADTAGIDFDEDLTRPRRRDRDFFDAVVTWAVRPHDGHRLVNHCIPLRSWLSTVGSLSPGKHSWSGCGVDGDDSYTNVDSEVEPGDIVGPEPFLRDARARVVVFNGVVERS